MSSCTQKVTETAAHLVNCQNKTQRHMTLMCQQCFSHLIQGAKIKMREKDDAVVKFLYRTLNSMYFC